MLEGRKTKAGSLRGKFDASLNDRQDIYEPMDKYIEGFSSMTSASKQESVLDFMTNIFNSRGFDPARVHSMADKTRSGSARFGTILQCLKKLMPQFEEEFIDNVPYVLKISEDDDIARKEWT